MILVFSAGLGCAIGTKQGALMIKRGLIKLNNLLYMLQTGLKIGNIRVLQNFDCLDLVSSYQSPYLVLYHKIIHPIHFLKIETFLMYWCNKVRLW